MDTYMSYLTGSGITLNVYGDDMEQMQSAARDLAAKLATVPGTENVSDGLEQAAAALHLSVDRNAAMEKGLTVAQVYMAVASALTDTRQLPVPDPGRAGRQRVHPVPGGEPHDPGEAPGSGN